MTPLGSAVLPSSHTSASRTASVTAVGVSAGRAGVGADRLHRRLLGDVPVDRSGLAGQQVAELVQHRAQVGLAALGALTAARHVEPEPEGLRTAWLAHPFTLTAKMEHVTVTEPRVRRGRSARSDGSRSR